MFRMSNAFAAINGAMKTSLVEDEGDEAEDDIEEEDERGKPSADDSKAAQQSKVR